MGVDKYKIPILREAVDEDFFDINPAIDNKNDIMPFNGRKIFSSLKSSLTH